VDRHQAGAARSAAGALPDDLHRPGALLPKVVTAVIRADTKGSLLDFLKP
jgi:hypothetical protein